jgi:hypothetical protein
MLSFLTNTSNTLNEQDKLRNIDLLIYDTFLFPNKNNNKSENKTESIKDTKKHDQKKIRKVVKELKNFVNNNN